MFEHLLEFETAKQGAENLKQAVDIRNSMCGVLYYNILEDVCCRIANRLLCKGGSKEEIDKILGR